MSIHRFPWSLCYAAVLALSTPALAAQTPLALVPLRMDQVMSRLQLEQAGLSSLTGEQRLVLDAWLTRYSAEVRRGDAPAADIMETEASNERPRAVRRERQGGRRTDVPVTVPIGARLVAAPDDGGFVRLADGTLWEISLPDRPTADAWRVRDYVAVSPAAAGVGEYDHILVNAHARTRAFARFAGLAPPRRR